MHKIGLDLVYLMLLVSLFDKAHGCLRMSKENARLDFGSQTLRSVRAQLNYRNSLRRHIKSDCRCSLPPEEPQAFSRVSKHEVQRSHRCCDCSWYHFRCCCTGDSHRRSTVVLWWSRHERQKLLRSASPAMETRFQAWVVLW